MVKKSDDTLEILRINLKTEKDKEQYLSLIISRMDESKRIMNKALILLGTFIAIFLLLAFADLKDISAPFLEKIDKRTVFFCLPSVFSAVYYYYILTWMHFVQQKQIYRHLTSQIFNVEVESHLNDHIQPYSFMEIFDKHHDTENKNVLGCLTNIIALPFLIISIFLPIIFVSFVLYKNDDELKLEGWHEWIGYVVPGIVAILLLLMLIKSVRLNVFGKE
jgi:hypothetical protein